MQLLNSYLRIPIVPQQVKNLTRVCEDVSLIPGIAQRGSRPSIAMSYSKCNLEAWICRCCGCGIGRQLQLRFDSLLSWRNTFCFILFLFFNFILS